MDEASIIDLLSSGNATPPPPWLNLGIGDDGAVLTLTQPICIATDTILDGTHFDSSHHGGKLLARKAVKVNLSDLAAMAAKPLAFLVNLSLPQNTDRAFVEQLAAGFAELQSEYSLQLIGGDTTTWRQKLAVSVTVLGLPSCPEFGYVSRGGAAPGDFLCVTGELGGSLLDDRHLHFTPRLQESAWLAARFLPTAMLDVSDGIALDLRRLCRASAVGAVIDRQALPCHGSLAHLPEAEAISKSMNDGEDFELLFTVKPANLPQLLAEWPFATRLTPIGRIVDGAKGLRWDTDQGEDIPFGGYLHRL